MSSKQKGNPSTTKDRGPLAVLGICEHAVPLEVATTIQTHGEAHECMSVTSSHALHVVYGWLSKEALLIGIEPVLATTSVHRCSILFTMSSMYNTGTDKLPCVSSMAA